MVKCTQQWLDLVKRQEASRDAEEKEKIELDIEDVQDKLRPLIDTHKRKQAALDKAREDLGSECRILICYLYGGSGMLLTGRQ